MSVCSLIRFTPQAPPKICIPWFWWNELIPRIVYSSCVAPGITATHISPWQQCITYFMWRYIVMNTWLRTDLIRLQTQWGCSTLVTMATQHTPDIWKHSMPIQRTQLKILTVSWFKIVRHPFSCLSVSIAAVRQTVPLSFWRYSIERWKDERWISACLHYISYMVNFWAWRLLPERMSIDRVAILAFWSDRLAQPD